MFDRLRSAASRAASMVLWPVHTRFIRADIKRVPLGISALVRTKDEEEWVEASLTSLLPLVDEIVVADASTDGTWERVQRFAAAHSGNVDIKLIHMAAAGTQSFLHRWRLPLSSELYTLQSNLGLRLCSRRIVIRWDGDYIGTDKLAELRRRLLELARIHEGVWFLSLPVVNIEGDPKHGNCVEPFTTEARVHVNWRGLEYRVTPNGRFEYLYKPFVLPTFYIDDVYIFHMVTLKPARRVMMRALWTNWRQAMREKPEQTPDDLEAYVRQEAERQYGLVGADLDEIAAHVLRWWLGYVAAPYDEARFGPLPPLVQLGAHYRVVYDAKGNIVGRDEGPQANDRLRENC